MNKKLKRTTNDKMIAGVCGGLAKYIGWKTNNLRIVYVLISLLSAAFPGLLVYLILWVVIPKEDLIV